MDRALLLRISSATLFLVATAAAAAPPLETVPDPALTRGDDATHDLCGVEVTVLNGRFSTGFTPQDDWDFTTSIGLWVGGRVDRGAGYVVSVSTGLYEQEFWSTDAPPPTSRAHELERGEATVKTYVDTFIPTFYPDHRPLGLEIVQESFPVNAPPGVHAVDVKFTMRNISHEYDAPGWIIDDIYIGMLADPDVGSASGLNYWTDDLGGCASGYHSTSAVIAPGARRGDLAYLYDAPGTGDDVDTQFGIVLRETPAHAFQIWSSGISDPSNDSQRYALMRGNTDGSPHVDPNPIVPNDYRFLLSAGPYESLAPGETLTFSASLVCGRLVISPSVEPQALEPRHARDRVVTANATALQLGDGSNDVEIFSVTGRRLATVEAGQAWNLQLDAGGRAPAGVYFWRPRATEGAAGKIVVRR